ncbi:MAG: four helix bundle protein [Gemmataceae bacterium]|nr:four helix bundle protein [Gemmataceae bacterium]
MRNVKQNQIHGGLIVVVDITDRTFEFSGRIVKLCRAVGRDPVNRVLGTQLLGSSTSVRANIEEAQAAQSKADFVSKTAIALKEARESHYWLRLLAATDAKLTNRLAPLVQESKEIRDILGASNSKARRKPAK